MKQDFEKWFSNDGDNTYRLKYDLNKDSIVFDLGGYKGEFSYKIYNKFASKIYIFEPVKQFYNNIENRFSNIEDIKVFNYGLGEKEEIDISVSNDATSIFCSSTDSVKEKILIEDFDNFLTSNNIDNIDLLKINIEGSEYGVMKYLIEHGTVNKIKNIQVQFHTFIDNYEEKYNEIYNELIKTHHLTWKFDFIWENWELKQD